MRYRRARGKRGRSHVVLASRAPNPCPLRWCPISRCPQENPLVIRAEDLSNGRFHAECLPDRRFALQALPDRNPASTQTRSAVSSKHSRPSTRTAEAARSIRPDRRRRQIGPARNSAEGRGFSARTIAARFYLRPAYTARCSVRVTESAYRSGWSSSSASRNTSGRKLPVGLAQSV